MGSWVICRVEFVQAAHKDSRCQGRLWLGLTLAQLPKGRRREMRLHGMKPWGPVYSSPCAPRPTCDWYLKYQQYNTGSRIAPDGFPGVPRLPPPPPCSLHFCPEFPTPAAFLGPFASEPTRSLFCFLDLKLPHLLSCSLQLLTSISRCNHPF